MLLFPFVKAKKWVIDVHLGSLLRFGLCDTCSSGGCTRVNFMCAVDRRRREGCWRIIPRNHDGAKDRVHACMPTTKLVLRRDLAEKNVIAQQHASRICAKGNAAIKDLCYILRRWLMIRSVGGVASEDRAQWGRLARELRRLTMLWRWRRRCNFHIDVVGACCDAKPQSQNTSRPYPIGHSAVHGRLSTAKQACNLTDVLDQLARDPTEYSEAFDTRK